MEQLAANKVKRQQTQSNPRESPLSIRKMKSHNDRESNGRIRLAKNLSALCPQFPVQQMLSQSDLEEQGLAKTPTKPETQLNEWVNPYTAKDESHSSVLCGEAQKHAGGFEFELDQAKSRFIKSDSEHESIDNRKMSASEASEGSHHDRLEVERMDKRTAEYLLSETLQEERYLHNKLRRLRKRIVNLRSRCGAEAGRDAGPGMSMYGKKLAEEAYNPYIEEKEVVSEKQASLHVADQAITKSATPRVHVVKLDRDTQMSTSLNKQSTRAQKIEKRDFSVNVKTCIGCSDCSNKEDSFIAPKQSSKAKQKIAAVFCAQIKKRESLKGVSRSRNETLTTEGSNQPLRIKAGVRTTSIYPPKPRLKDTATKPTRIQQRPAIARKRPLTDCTLTDFNPFSDQCLTHTLNEHRPQRLHSHYSKRSFQQPAEALSISDGERNSKEKTLRLHSGLNADRIFRIGKR